MVCRRPLRASRGSGCRSRSAFCFVFSTAALAQWTSLLLLLLLLLQPHRVDCIKSKLALANINAFNNETMLREAVSLLSDEMPICETYPEAKLKRPAGQPLHVYPAHFHLLDTSHSVPSFFEKQIPDCSVPCIATNKQASADVLVGTLSLGPKVAVAENKKITAVVSFESCHSTGCQNLGEDVLISYSPVADQMQTYGNFSLVDWAHRPVPTRPVDRRPAGLVFVSTFCTNWRGLYLQALAAAGFNLHSAGQCFHNMDVPNCKREQYQAECTPKAIGKYPFALTFENTIMDGYVTEKWIHMWKSGAIPVYAGSPTIDESYEEDFPPFINALKFRTPKALVAYLKQVLVNDTLWEHYTGRGAVYQAKVDKLQAKYARVHNNARGMRGQLCAACEVVEAQRPPAQ